MAGGEGLFGWIFMAFKAVETEGYALKIYELFFILSLCLTVAVAWSNVKVKRKYFLRALKEFEK